MTVERPLDIEVDTPGGSVLGTALGGVLRFRGIPYGDRVDGAARFRPALPAPAWTGVRDARRTGPRAVQRAGNLFQTRVGEYFTGARVGELGLNDQIDDENCLVLNVLTPATSGARPVMVYLHGGGFAEGSGVLAVAADRLVREEDVVVVSVNHRLNVFGFLAVDALSSDREGSGNVGLLDLVLALEWVRSSIRSFGGDPDNVTVFGESGGGGKVTALLAMPTAVGLFRRAIVQSGSIARARTASQAAADTRWLLERLGAEAGALVSIPPRTLIDAAAGGLDRFRPVVDGVVLDRHPFEPDAPRTAADVPLLVGHCLDEMDWLYADDPDLLWLDEGTATSRLARRLALPAGDARDVLDAYRAQMPDASPSARFLRAASDGLFGKMATDQADRKSRQPAGVFRYEFRFDTPVEHGRYHAFHTAELPLVFRLVQYPEMEPLSRLIASCWAAFARSGDPSTDRVAWPEYDTDRRRTMILEATSHVEADPRADARRLWERFPQAQLFADAAAQPAIVG